MKRTALFFAASALVMAAACKDRTPPKAPPPPPPVKPAPPAPAVDGGTAGRPLGMMERHALWKAKKEAEEKAAAEARARLVQFDKGKLAKHVALLAFERKTRQALDQAAEKLNGKLDAADQLKKLASSQKKAIDTQATGLRALDPQGGNSFIAGDHDVVLHLLANDYPAAILAFFQGQTKALAEARAELDKRDAKISAWLEEVKASKDEPKAEPKAAPKKEPKAGKDGAKPAP